MPACKECSLLIEGRCSIQADCEQILGRKLPPPPLGTCMMPIVESYLSLIESGDTVLDIGCGTWDRIKRYCESSGARYEAIDVQREYFGRPVVATRIENLGSLSFPDEHFDFVIGNQTMEHWAEYGCNILWGLRQCFRVCKTGGKVLMNVPIHFHGTSDFILGRIRRIEKYFAPFSDSVTLDKWGSPGEPLPPIAAHPGYWRLKGRPAYVLDIRAVKDRPLPSDISNRGTWRGRVAQLAHYPVSYNIYRVLRKTGIIDACRVR
jgi:SAM-dependent methyltransferase